MRTMTDGSSILKNRERGMGNLKVNDQLIRFTGVTSGIGKDNRDLEAHSALKLSLPITINLCENALLPRLRRHFGQCNPSPRFLKGISRSFQLRGSYKIVPSIPIAANPKPCNLSTQVGLRNRTLHFRPRILRGRLSTDGCDHTSVPHLGRPPSPDPFHQKSSSIVMQQSQRS
ncbi:hypothetical protein M433DRAFT_213927 [Acidomyces richmondensis BFW]|nr:hypothetical protein M433DRAFT_213927 [Acidomyces richmondensis BFW]